MYIVRQRLGLEFEAKEGSLATHEVVSHKGGHTAQAWGSTTNRFTHIHPNSESWVFSKRGDNSVDLLSTSWSWLLWVAKPPLNLLPRLQTAPKRDTLAFALVVFSKRGHRQVTWWRAQHTDVKKG